MDHRWHLRDVIAVFAVQIRPSTESRALLTNQIRTWFISLSQGCSNVVSTLPSHSPHVSFILISSSPDFDVLNQQRAVVMTNFMRMLSGNVSVNVIKSTAVIWWAATSRTSHRCSTKCCICQSPRGSTMSRLRSHNFREAVGNLLTVTMHLQDASTRFHRPGLFQIELRVDSQDAFHEAQSCCAVRAHNNRPR